MSLNLKLDHTRTIPIASIAQLVEPGFSQMQDIASITLKNELGTPKKLSCASFGTRNNF